MRIMARLNLMSAGIILAMTAAVLAVGVLTLDGILYSFQERVLRLEMSRATQSILQQLNLSGVRSAAAQAGVVDRALRRQEGLRSARLYIVEEPGRRIVYHPEKPAGAPLGLALVDQLFEQGEGALEHEEDGVAHYAVFATVQPLGWLFVLSIDKSEMLQGRADFLRAIGGVTFLVLLINAVLVGLFGRRHTRRIGEALACVKRIEAGELSARIPSASGGDEIGRLQAGINAMSAGLQQRALAQREAEAALRATEARNRRLVDANIIGIFFWDMNGVVTDANDAFLAMVGRSRAELREGALDWMRITPPRWIAVDLQRGKELLARGICGPYEKEFLRADGSLVPVLIGSALFEDSRETGVAFVLDTSARKAAEAEREGRRVAEAASRAKDEFLANMSHELRTPLNAVLGYTELLRREPGLADRHAGWLATIAHSGQHLLTLINDLLDAAKIEAGKLELALRQVELAAFLDGVANIMRERMEDKGLRLVTEFPRGPLTIWADEKRLRQVLLNLLGNAAKFTDAGEVALRAGLQRRDAATLRLRIEVVDTGVGMTHDQLEAIFRPFEQVGEASRRAAGTGLGLAISRQLVHLMGGELGVESAPAVGSRFWFEIDVAVAQEAPAPVDGEESAAAPGLSVEGEGSGPAMVVPGRAELEVLHGLALAGSMRDIREQADRLAAADPGYAPFAGRLRALANAFRSQAILALVEGHLNKDRVT